MSRRNKALGLAKEIRRRQQHTKPTLTLVPPLRTPQQYRDAFGPRPEWCDWTPWGYLMPERDGIDTPTQVMRVVDLAHEHSFAELSGRVTP